MVKKRKDNKLRIDAWEAHLSDEARWDIFYRLRTHKWFEVAKYAVETYSAPEPGRMTLYRFADRMRSLESDRRLGQVVLAQAEAARIACKSLRNDDALIESYKMLAADIALSTGDAETANKFVRMALDLAAANTKEKELELKERAQNTKEKQLQLMREKFEAAERRENEARETMEDTKLTPAEKEEKLKQIFGI